MDPLADLFDPVKQHLRVNHFPVVLALVGALACVVAAALRRDAVWRYALVTVVLAAVTAPLAYWTGLRAEDIAAEYELIASGDMEPHENAATAAMIALLVSGVAAGVALRKPSVAARWIALVLVLAAAGLMTWTAKIGGGIVHNQDTEGHPPK
jgi:uncharacterized membrane protein